MDKVMHLGNTIGNKYAYALLMIIFFFFVGFRRHIQFPDIIFFVGLSLHIGV